MNNAAYLNIVEGQDDLFKSTVSQHLDGHFQHDYGVEYQEHYNKLSLL